MFDPSKPLRTRSGVPVTLLTQGGRTPYPLVGYVGNATEPTVWTASGRYAVERAHPTDLVNGPVEVWLNIYSGGVTQVYATKPLADRGGAGCDTRIACIRIEYTEGQGLDTNG